jgi:peptide/nickel transport system permease protein
MLSFFVKRLIATIPVLVMVAIFVFLMLRMASGDPAAILAGDNGTPQQIEEIRHALGLDEPVPVQLWIYITDLLRGDLGTSYFFKKPVSELIMLRVEPTLALAVTTLIISIVIAVPVGVFAAYRHGTWFDRGVMAFSVLGFSVPIFVVGYILVYIFAMELKWFPVQGYKDIGDGFFPFIHRLVLPSIALSVIYVALIARITRASVLETLNEDYIRTAYAKGLTSSAVLLRHALRNALVPIITVIGIGVALLIGGVVVTETVFNIPGLGRLTVDAVLGRDYPTVQAIILVFSFVYVFINLLIDLSYSFLDPRIRY